MAQDTCTFVLVDDVLASLSVHWRRGGIHTGVLAEGWAVYPHAVIGRLCGGAGRVDFERAASVRIGDGDGYLLPPATQYRFVPLSARPCTYRWMHIDVRVLGTVDLLAVIVPPVRLPQGQRVGEIAEAFVQVAQVVDPLRREVTRRRLGYELLELVLAGATGDLQHPVRIAAWQRLQPALALMQASLDRPLGRTVLARHVGLSPTRFHAVFSAAMGCAPVRYLQRLRIERAQQLLLSTELTIAAIGRAVGLADPFHFSRVFRRSVGVSPRTYRQQGRLRLSSPVPVQGS